MRIGQFSDTFLPVVDGVGRVVYSYASTLARKGHECTVIAPMADTGYRGGYPFELVDFFSVGVPTQKQYSTGIPQLDSHYEARLNMIPFDVVHAHSPFVAGQEAIRVARKRDIPLVGMFHSRYYDDFYKLTKQERLANIAVSFIVNFYERCDSVWTVSTSSAEALNDYGYKGNIEIVSNGTQDILPDDARKAFAIEQLKLPTDRPILLYCGQMNWKKNIENILSAAAMIAAEGADFTLVLAGQGPDAAAIRARVEELSLASRTIMTGHIQSDKLLFGLYQAASLFVFPSLYDTSGMVVREAASMETPSVVSAGSAPAEPIEDGVNGFIADNTPSSLAKAILGALSDSARLQKIGCTARKSIYMSWDKIMDQVLELYQGLIDGK